MERQSGVAKEMGLKKIGNITEEQIRCAALIGQAMQKDLYDWKKRCVEDALKNPDRYRVW